ncbi:helix-turn-helix domain-containing protein [Mucilaginibacter sp.]|uniref:helix-turn-helix domain-containing protein n=1 Tax=Mucilaginibacter sp. TaxID=1882438 RepID=UPI00326514AB
MAAEIITKEDLVQFKKELITEFKTILNNSTTDKVSDEWLRTSQVRKLLHISAGTLQSLRIQHNLPYTKIGSLIYYKRKDIELLMEGGGK